MHSPSNYRAIEQVRRFRSIGFTLIELAVSLMVITLLLVVVLKSSSVTTEARAQAVMAIAKDLTAAAITFKTRYGYFPGDMPSAQTEFPSLPLVCNLAVGVAPGIGNGLVDQDPEIACVIDELQAARVVSAQSDPLNPGRYLLRSTFGNVRVVAAGISTAGAAAPQTSNVIEFASLPCEIVQRIDAKLDDGNLNSGQARGSIGSCVPGGVGDPVPFFAVRMN